LAFASLSGVQAKDKDDEKGIKSEHFIKASIATGVGNGIGQILRAEALTAIDKKKIQTFSLIGGATSALELIAGLISQYKVTGFQLSTLRNLAELFNAFRTYRGAEKIAQFNRKGSAEDKGNVKKMKMLLQAIVAANTAVQANRKYDTHKYLAKKIRKEMRKEYKEAKKNHENSPRRYDEPKKLKEKKVLKKFKTDRLLASAFKADTALPQLLNVSSPILEFFLFEHFFNK